MSGRLTAIQRWIGFLSFMVVCGLIWTGIYFWFFPMPGVHLWGFFAGVFSLILALSIFDSHERQEAVNES